MDVDAQASGVVVADISVRPVSGVPYRVKGLQLRTSTRAGDATVFSPWSGPRFADFAFIYLRGATREPLQGVEVVFRRTGGVQLANPADSVFRITTPSSGTIPFFNNLIQPIEAGDLIGDLTINIPAPFTPTVHKDVHIPATPNYHPGALIRSFGAGPSLAYHLEVDYRGKYNTHVAGAQVTFQRTGGIMIDPPSWTQTTADDGRAIFYVRPLESGTLIGDVTVVPPAPWKSYTRTGMQFPTFDDDGAILYAILWVGPGLSYYVIIRNNGVPMKGVEVDFQRTGGIEVSPASLSSVTNDSGMVFIAPEPASEGDLTADITVKPPAPLAGFVVRGLKLTAVDADIPGGRILLGDWDLASPPTGAVRQP